MPQTLESRINLAHKKLGNAHIDLAWKDTFPQEDFHWAADEAGDWVPYNMGRLEPRWIKCAYANEVRRIDGLLQLTVHTVDQDGNWEIDLCNDIEGDAPEHFGSVNEEMMKQLPHHFLQWAEYFLTCSEYDNDPLGEYTWRGGTEEERRYESMRSAQNCLEHALGVMEKMGIKV